VSSQEIEKPELTVLRQDVALRGGVRVTLIAL